MGNINSDSIKTFIENLPSNPWIIIISLGFTILSVILAIIFFIKSIKKKSPRFLVRSRNLVQKLDNNSDIKIYYNDEPVNNLTFSKVVIWNNGKETIHDRDITSSDPLMISVEDEFTILDVEILDCPSESNLINVEKLNNKSVRVDFEYLDHKDGCIIQVIHDGKNSENINVSGTIKGYGTLKEADLKKKSRIFRVIEYVLDKNRSVMLRSVKFMSFFMFIMPIVLFVTIIMDDPSLLRSYKKLVPLFLITIPYWWLAIIMKSRVVPRRFSSFYDDFEDIS